MPPKFDDKIFPNGLLQLEHIPGTDKYRIIRDFHYVARDGKTYVAIEYTVIDGYSIPWFLRGLLQRVRKYFEGPAVHDPAYGGELYVLVGTRLTLANLPRKKSDKLIKEIMQRMGASKALYQAVYYGLRIGGAGKFNG